MAIIPERRRAGVQVGDIETRLEAISQETNPGERSKAISALSDEVARAGKDSLDAIIERLGNANPNVVVAAIAVVTHPHCFGMYARTSAGLGVVVTEISALLSHVSERVALVAASTIQFLMKGSRIDPESSNILRADIKAARERWLDLALVLSYAEDEIEDSNRQPRR